jgi:hypothetical protein
VAPLGEPAVARHRRTEMTGKRRLTGVETAARRDGDGQRVGAARRRQRRRLGSDSGRADTAGRGGGERDARSGGRARRAGQLSADKLGPLVSDIRIKIYLKGN